MTEEFKNNDDVKKLELAHTIREFHHKSLWEEEKHFTWWVSIVFSGLIVLYTNNGLCYRNKLIFIIIGSLIGIFLCITALRIMIVEGGYFHTALARFVNEYNKIFKTSPLPPVPEEPNKKLRDLIKLFFIWKLGVRDSFQFLFYFLMLIFSVILVWSVLTLILLE